jgi:hypothetical protein
MFWQVKELAHGACVTSVAWSYLRSPLRFPENKRLTLIKIIFATGFWNLVTDLQLTPCSSLLSNNSSIVLQLEAQATNSTLSEAQANSTSSGAQVDCTQSEAQPSSTQSEAQETNTPSLQQSLTPTWISSSHLRLHTQLHHSCTLSLQQHMRHQQ